MLRKFTVFAFCLALILPVTTPVSAQDTGTISATDIWARPAAEGETSATYMMITNSTNADITLVAASASVANVVEIHESSMNDQGVMQMRPLDDGLTIPAGESAELRPGGFHIMMMGIPEALEIGDAFALTLTLETKAGEEEIVLGVPVLEFPPIPGDIVVERVWSDEAVDPNYIAMFNTIQGSTDVKLTYFAIENTGDKDVTLISGTTDFGMEVRIREILTTDDGRLYTEPLEDGLTIPAEERIRFGSGGSHDMEFWVVDGEKSKAFQEVEAFAFELVFDNEEIIVLAMPTG